MIVSEGACPWVVPLKSRLPALSSVGILFACASMLLRISGKWIGRFLEALA